MTSEVVSKLIPPISRGTLLRGKLSGKVAVVTGAGRGIGYEAARSLAWLGARVVIAEVNAASGEESARRISDEMGDGAAKFVWTDVGDEESVNHLAREVFSAFGRADIIINNATIFAVGAVSNTSIRDWDSSYRVNLRGPVLLARAFLPAMLEANSGVFIAVSSSGAAPYLGAYEVFKTAQVELANTLDAELEGTEVIAFTIGPGLVRTPGSTEGIGKLAPLYGKTVEEFHQRSSQAEIPVEEAGAGFAAAAAMAGRYRGKEISSMAALIEAGIPIPGADDKRVLKEPSAERGVLLQACREAKKALERQNSDWKKYSVFFRRWMFRDFKKNAGMAIDQWLDRLERCEASLEREGNAEPMMSALPDLRKMKAFYDHLADSQKGYQKDPVKQQEGLKAIEQWQEPVKHLVEILENLG
jgi:NAD(P)-dependent dehydrogenase (short-subunit alcohol dehydrogenase family)